MLVQERNPNDLLVARICEHALGEIPSNLKSPHVTVLLEPGNGYPLVAWVETGCKIREHNPDLPENAGDFPCKLLFVADTYIGGVSEDERGQYFCVSVPYMLPWYESAIRDFMLPEGWSINKWVFKTPLGEEIAYCTATSDEGDAVSMKYYFDGTVDMGQANPNDAREKYDSGRKRIAFYINHVLQTQDEDRVRGGEFNEETMAQLIVPVGIEETAMRETYGTNNTNDKAKTRQALQAYIQGKVGIPVHVFDKVYAWPNS